MMLPVETLKLIQDTAVTASGCKEYEISPLKTKLVFRDGRTEIIEKEPEPRCEIFTSLDDLVRSAKISSCSNTEIWVSDVSVILCYDNDKRIDKGSYSLGTTKAYSDLCDYYNMPGHPFTQREFIHLLKYTFGLDPVTVAPFTRIQWNFSSNTDRELKHNVDRLGKDIRQEAMSEKGIVIPEEITVPIYVCNRPTPRVQDTVRCGVELNIQEQRIMLHPNVEDIQAARVNAVNVVYDYIVAAMGSDDKVYRGIPW